MLDLFAWVHSLVLALHWWWVVLGRELTFTQTEAQKLVVVVAVEAAAATVVVGPLSDDEYGA